MTPSLWSRLSNWRYDNAGLSKKRMGDRSLVPFTIQMRAVKANSIGRRNTLTMEVFSNGDRGLE